MSVTMFERINSFLYKVEMAYDGLNGWKKVMLSAFLLIPSIMDWFNEYVQTITAITGLILAVWTIVKGYYQIELWKEDLRMKRLNRRIKEEMHDKQLLEPTTANKE